MPCLRYVPAATAASAMNSPACSAAQNGCTASDTWALENRAIHCLLTSKSRGGTTLALDEIPGDSRTRADRRYSSPYGLASAPTGAHPIKRLGRSVSALALRLVLRSPREPKDPLTGHGK